MTKFRLSLTVLNEFVKMKKLVKWVLKNKRRWEKMNLGSSKMNKFAKWVFKKNSEMKFALKEMIDREMVLSKVCRSWE
jgi:hypothetical protein